MTPVATGRSPPRRETLGDTDSSTWEMDANGEPRDPWQLSAYLPMMAQDNGELFTFSTSSRGGHGAVGDLARLYARHRRKQPDELPIVGLGIRVYEHREYGRIKNPAFPVSGWESKDRFNAALIEAGVTPIEPEPVKPLPPVGEELSDSIPF